MTAAEEEKNESWWGQKESFSGVQRQLISVVVMVTVVSTGVVVNDGVTAVTAAGADTE